jgi:four helix bundle protein
VKKKVYAIAARPKIARDFEFCKQIRESARSAPRNIAEGFGRYRPAEFARFLDIARGSLQETHNHTNDALDLGYIDAKECDALCRSIGRAAKATVRLIAYLKGPGRNHGTFRTFRTRRTSEPVEPPEPPEPPEPSEPD